MKNIVDLFETKARASECRLRAANSSGSHRQKLLALADEYDVITEALLALEAEQLCLCREEFLSEIPQNKQSDA